MTTGFEIRQPGEGRILIILHADCSVSRDDIITLLRDAGIDVTNVTFLSPDEAVDISDLNQCSVIIPIDKIVCENSDLESAAMHSGNAGGRVIALFSQDYSYEGLHPIADKFGAQCGWFAKELSRLIDGSEISVDGGGAKVKHTRPRQVDCN